MKEKTDLLREAIEKEFTLELNPLLENFNNDFNSNIRTFYFEAKANHDLINHEDDDRKRQEQIAFKNLLQQQYTSQAFKDFFKDLSLSEYALEDKIVKLYADERTIESFLIQKNSIKGSPCDFFSVCLGVRGWKNFKPNNIPKRIEKSEQDIQKKPIENNGSVEKNSAIRLRNIPNLQIEDYVPRISIVEEISSLFEQKNKKINIKGISGSGKTFLAKHFVQHYSSEFSNIVWLNCSEGFLKAFIDRKGTKLLDTMGLSSEHQSFLDGNMELESLVGKLLGRLQIIKENSVLVLDNVDEEILFYEDELNLFSNWKILTTSQESLNGFCNYTIPSFEEEALKLFYKYYTLELDDDKLICLLSAIEYHTLTIELLAKTAKQRRLTIIELVNRFIKNGINVVERAKIFADHNNRNTKIENIEEYLNIVFDTSALSEEECKMLLNIAVLQSEPIEINLFKEVYLNASSDNKVLDIFEYNISILRSKGWIKIESDGLRLHGLVKSIIIKKFVSRDDYFNSTIKYLRGISSIEHTQNFLQKSKYLKLSESVLEKIHFENRDTIYLKNIIALFYTSIGLYEKANKYEVNYLNQLNDTQEIAGNVSDKTIDILVRLNNLSSSYVSQGKFEDALIYALKLYNFFDEDVIQELYSHLTDGMISFFKKNKIDDSSKFEGIFNLTGHVKVVNMILISMSYIVMFQDKKKNLSTLPKIIAGLEKIFLSRQRILDIFEGNISEPLIFSIRTYKDLLLSNTTLSIIIGQYYIELKEYDKAEEIFIKNLLVQGKILDQDHFDFSHIYHSLTCLYIKWGNVEQARYYLEKNKTICSLFPSNHPCVILLKSDIKGFEKLEDEKFVSENLEKIIQSRFDNLYEKNKDSTKLTDYYEILYSIYFRYDNYEKASEYVTKEINAINNNGNIAIEKLFALYLKSSECHLLLVDFNKAWELYSKALILCNEEELKYESIDSQIKKHKEKIITCGVAFNDVPTIRGLITRELEVLKGQYIVDFSESFSKERFLTIMDKIFGFLYDLPDLKQTIKDTEANGERMGLFLTKYDDLIKEFAVADYPEIQKSKIGYKILNGYYQTFINIFLKYKNWDLTCRYCFKKLFVNDKYYEKFHDTGSIHYTISYCYYNLRQFELAGEEVAKAISNFNKALESIHNQKETYKQIERFLKEALDLEKLIKEEIEKFITQ